MKIYTLVVDRGKLILGAGLKYSEAYEPLEKTLGKQIISYIKDVLSG